jgi:ABC-type polysaccharide/polyol phosphate transport system ATPase subunit
LLKVIAKILTPNRGVVESRGTMSSLLELGTGFHPELTGRENVYLGGSLLGQRRAAIDARYDEIVEFAGIADFMDLPVKNYSSGMYARLAFAVAISVEPDILLIDEVLSVGDESFQMRCFERIAEYRAEGRTIILVSHGLDNIRSLCSDAIWLDHGAIKAIGASHDVVGKYLSEVHRTAEHLGGTAPTDRYGSMEAEIVDVKFLDGMGKTQGAFRTGEPMTIKVDYRAPAPIREASCLLQVYRADNLWQVYGQATRDAGIELVLERSGQVEFRIPALPLLKGTYVVSVTLQDEHARKVFDCHDRKYSFLVFENTELFYEAGAVHIDGVWSSTSSSLAV